MSKSTKLGEGTPRSKGSKGDIFLDSIDFNILSLTQSDFKNADDLSKALNISPKNLHPHIMKLVNVGLLDGIRDSTTNQYVFTCYYKITGTKNDFGFTIDNRSVPVFLNDINSYIQRSKFEGAMEKLKTSDKVPEINKK